MWSIAVKLDTFWVRPLIHPAALQSFKQGFSSAFPRDAGDSNISTCSNTEPFPFGYICGTELDDRAIIMALGLSSVVHPVDPWQDSLTKTLLFDSMTVWFGRSRQHLWMEGILLHLDFDQQDWTYLVVCSELHSLFSAVWLFRSSLPRFWQRSWCCQKTAQHIVMLICLFLQVL